ncbi:MAG: DNA methyltransferase [Promethearchaeota archaeon]
MKLMLRWNRNIDNGLKLPGDFNSIFGRDGKFNEFKLIFLDLSNFVDDGNSSMSVIANYRDFPPGITNTNARNHVVAVQGDFFSKLERLLKELKIHVDAGGFLSIFISGQYRHYVKVLLDEIMGYGKFMNEVFVYSPVFLKNSQCQSIPLGESTSSLLIYKNSPATTVNAVYNSKKSGGYWHALDSAEPGPARTFVFNTPGGKAHRISPPAGCHWKFSQDVIDRRCLEGTIRLSSRGKPQYWVEEKEGHIIDNKWFDIQALDLNERGLRPSVEFYKRLLLTLTNPGDSILHLRGNESTLKEVGDELKRMVVELEILDYMMQQRGDCAFESTDIHVGHREGKSAPFPTKMHVVEQHNYKGTSPRVMTVDDNHLIMGDNLRVLERLKETFNERIQLIYIDPPYFTGLDEKIHVPVVSSQDADKQETHHAIAYKNKINQQDAPAAFVNWFQPRLQLMRDLLSPRGFIVVRIDYHFGHYAKAVLDSIFGKRHFISEILARRIHKTITKKGEKKQKHLINQTDSLFVYRKTAESRVKGEVIKVKRKNGDRYETLCGWDNVWTDIAGYEKSKKTLYPTENSRRLLERIITLFSGNGDVVADFFNGSGTTVAVAQSLGRKWLGVDESPFSINETEKRLLRDDPSVSFLYSEVDGCVMRSESKLLEDGRVKVSIQERKGTRGRECRECNEVTISLEGLVPMIDVLMVDWNNNPKQPFNAVFYSSRVIGRNKKINKGIPANVKHEYKDHGVHHIAVKIVDLYGRSTITRFSTS